MENPTFTPTDQEREVFNLHVELGIESDPEQDQFNPLSFISEIKEKSRSIKESCELGLIDPIDTMIALTQCSKMLEEMAKSIKEIAIREFEKHSEKTIGRFGFQITKTAGATYSYKHSQTWTALKYECSQYEQQMKTVAQCLAESKPIPEQLQGIEPAERKESEQSLAFKPIK